MIKAVFIDLDGTLLNSHHEVSQANKEALSLLDEKNIPYFIATGRPDQLVKKIIKDLNYNREMIMMNGSVIGHPFKEKRIRDLTLPQPLAKDIIDYCLKHDYLIMLYTHHAIFSDDNERVQFFKAQHADYDEECKAVFKPLSSYHGEGINKILVVEHDLKKYEALQDLLKTMPVSAVQSQRGFLDINPLSATKGSAIGEILDYYQIDSNDAIAFGDQDNDLSMRDYVSTFIAMGNAKDNVKLVADYVTEDHNYDGVALWLKRHILK